MLAGKNPTIPSAPHSAAAAHGGAAQVKEAESSAKLPNTMPTEKNLQAADAIMKRFNGHDFPKLPPK